MAESPAFPALAQAPGDATIDEMIGTIRGLVERPADMGERSPRVARALRQRRMGRLAAEIREMEGETLRHFRSLPHVEGFFSSRKPIRLLVGSNQSGKTGHGLVEVARALTGQDPYGKYPKENGRAILVGYDGDHLADPLYRKLFVEGEFKMIRDERSGRLRSVRPDPADPKRLDPYDEAHREKWIDAPPLIPPRFVAEQAWEHANKEIPRVTRLINDWRVLWRSSNSRPPRGRQVHLVVFDEDLMKAGVWVNEMIPRMIKHDGKLVWMATGQEGGPELLELVSKAEEGSADIAVWPLFIWDNPYMSAAQRRLLRDTLTSEEEVAVRYRGEIATARRKVYREYDPQGVHGFEPFPIPAGWARYVLVDPSRQHCGTLFLAVDPEERHAWVYDGFDLQQGNALDWAALVKKRQGTMKFEAGVMDMHIGRTRHTGGFDDRSVAAYYWQACAEVGVQFRRAGPLAGFFPGLDDVEARTLALKNWMALRGSGPFAGTPKLRVARGQIPLLDRQIGRAHTDPGKGQKRAEGPEQDLLDALEYGAAFEPGYYAPEPLGDRGLGEPPKPISVAERFREKHRRRAEKLAALGRGGTQLTAAMEIG